MAHQVLEEYNSLPTTQTTNTCHKTVETTYKNKCLLMVTFEFWSELISSMANVNDFAGLPNGWEVAFDDIGRRYYVE